MVVFGVGDGILGDRPYNQIKGKYNIVGGLEKQFNVCYKENRTFANNYWQAANPLLKFLPKLMMQLGIVIVLTRIVMIILKPIRQPRFVSEILAGIALGPSLLSRMAWVSTYINPFEGALLLETVGNLGVTFYMFLVGLEIDLTPIRKLEKTSCSVAIAGIILPGIGGMGLYYLVREQRKESPHEGGFFLALATGRVRGGFYPLRPRPRPRPR
ncbi:hypothetical protein DITRI_Ditri13aG0008100 [Diplodiscus trichospermus]